MILYTYMRIIVLIVSLAILLVFMVFYMQMTQQINLIPGKNESSEGIQQQLNEVEKTTTNYKDVLNNAQEKTNDALKNK